MAKAELQAAIVPHATGKTTAWKHFLYNFFLFEQKRSNTSISCVYLVTNLRSATKMFAKKETIRAAFSLETGKRLPFSGIFAACHAPHRLITPVTAR